MKLSKSIKLKIGAAVFAGMTFGALVRAESPAYPSQAAVDDANARARADQYALQQDNTNLTAEQNSLASLTSERDREARRLDYLQHQATTPAPISTSPHVDPAALKQQLDAAKANADKAHDEAVAKFEQTDTWKQANDAFEHARQNLQGPTDAVFDRLGQTREFQNLVAEARTAKQNADKLHDDPHADPKVVQQAQDAFTAADNRVQEMEEKTLQADATVMAGRKAVDAAQNRLQQLRDQFEHNLANDPTFAALVAKIQALQQAPQASVQPTSPPPAPAVDPQLIQQEQAKLDQMNNDVGQLQQDVTRLSARVQDDQDALADAQHDAAAAQDALAAAAPPPSPVVDAYAAPVYPAPVYAYSGPAYVPAYDYYGGVYLNVGAPYYGDYYGSGYYHGSGRHSRGYTYYGYGNSGYASSGYRGSSYRGGRNYTSGRNYSTARSDEVYNRSASSSRSYSRGYADVSRSSYRASESRYAEAPRTQHASESRSFESSGSHDSGRSESSHADYSSHGSDSSSHGHSH